MSRIQSNLRDIPWVEKYRPQSLTEIVSQSATIQTLQVFVKNQMIPHLIFAGPAGTGKTSTAKSLINDLLGKDNITKDAILERNASDNVRMGSRDEIKDFVNHSLINNENSFKFLILDEADNIPKAMQGAFRRIIEMAPPNVKFIFMCNYIENIIDPILSRCAIFRFYPLPKKYFDKQLISIAKQENIPINSEILEAIFYITQGDMRQAINLFQMIVALAEDTTGKLQPKTIISDIIYEISGFLPKKKLDEIFSNLTQIQFLEVIRLIHTFKGISSRGLFRQILTKISEKNYAFPYLEKMIITLSEYDYRLTLEADPHLQLDALFAELMMQMEAID